MQAVTFNPNREFLEVLALGYGHGYLIHESGAIRTTPLFVERCAPLVKFMGSDPRVKVLGRRVLKKLSATTARPSASHTRDFVMTFLQTLVIDPEFDALLHDIEDVILCEVPSTSCSFTSLVGFWAIHLFHALDL